MSGMTRRSCDRRNGRVKPGVLVCMRRGVVAVLLWVLAVIQPAQAARPQIKCMGRWVTIIGTPGDDELSGTDKRDVILALAGDDTIDLGRDDIVCAGRGDDMVTGSDRGQEHVYGGPGSDLVFPYGKADVVRGGKGADHLFGNFGSDSLFGDRGPDEVRGWNGADVVRGGPGADQLHGDGDVEYHAHGDDFIRGGRGTDTIGWIERGVKVDMRAGRAVGEGTDRFVGVEVANRRLF